MYNSGGPITRSSLGLADLFNLAGSLAHRPLHVANHPVFHGIVVKTRIPRVSLQYIIELGTSLLLLQSASHPVPDTDTSSAGFHFLSLPVELRPVFYNEHLVQSDDMLRTSCTCKFCANMKIDESYSRQRLSEPMVTAHEQSYLQRSLTCPLLQEIIFLFILWAI